MKKIFLSFFIALLFLGCVSHKIDLNKFRPYTVNGKTYHPFKKVKIGYTEVGMASWYGFDFHGKYTSDGEVYNMFDYTAAHKTLPMNTIVKVTNLENGKSVIVRINDRGPFVKNRIIDLSYIAAKKIGLDKMGTAKVKITVIGYGKSVSQFQKTYLKKYFEDLKKKTPNEKWFIKR